MVWGCKGTARQWDLLGACERPGSARIAARGGARKKDIAIWQWVTPERVDPSPSRMAADGAGRGYDKGREILPTMVLAQNTLVHRSKRAAAAPCTTYDVAKRRPSAAGRLRSKLPTGSTLGFADSVTDIVGMPLIRRMVRRSWHVGYATLEMMERVI